MPDPEDSANNFPSVKELASCLPPLIRIGDGDSLADFDIDYLRGHQKKVEPDWYAIFNPEIPRTLDVDLIHTLPHDSYVCCVRFSHDGKYVATGSHRSAQVYDILTGQNICVLKHELLEVVGDMYIRSVCFSPGGRFLATGAGDFLVRVWDIRSGKLRNTFTGHEQDICSLDFTRDGRFLASGSGDNTVRLWDIDEGCNTRTLTIENGVSSVALSSDSKYVAVGSFDKSVRVWNIKSGFVVQHLEGPESHKNTVYSVAFTPDDKDLVSGSFDGTIKTWKLAGSSGEELESSSKDGPSVRTLKGHKDLVLSVALTKDGNWILSSSKDRTVQLWDYQTGISQLMLRGHEDSVLSVAPSPTDNTFVTGGGDKKARIWNYKAYQPTAKSS